ncbi:hypothetical protein [Leptospira weilii]|uniref:Uncharacterized protein n=1 Tax=Leptospira weilii str. UI 13098 TaxID=1088542 RepID=M6QNY4_9LEPT|nr:hypothetical protein [Leptospira weilii]EMN90567.1 hypothetical protein LEP1GSC108_2798 [Leptospira weilii str. UI 13098]
MAQRYYLYYKQTGTGKLAVGKPTGYSNFLHNPDAKRMSFVLPTNQGKAQESIGKFVQDFQRLNAGQFVISNAVTGTVSQPTPPAPAPKPPYGGTDPKPNPTKITITGSTEPKNEEKKDDNFNLILIAAVVIVVLIVVGSSKKGKKK